VTVAENEMEKHSVNVFFADASINRLLENAYLRLSDKDIEGDTDDLELFIGSFAAKFLRYLYTRPEDFDEHCTYNIQVLGDQLIRSAKKIAAGDMSELGSVFAIAYRFFVEFQLRFTGHLNDEIASYLSRVDDFNYPKNIESQIRYAQHRMLIGVAKSFISHPRIGDVRSLEALLERAKEEREAGQEKLEKSQNKVSELAATLEKYTTAFNFVGLYDAFRGLREQKRIEARNGRIWLAILGAFMVMPFGLKFYAVIYPGLGWGLDTAAYVSFVGFELILTYFFRVGLHGYRTVQAQLIQIDLRMALCQFVQEYANYAKDMQKTSPGTLDKFDQLIFSGIVNDERAIPSTFDGVDHLANLISKVKSK